MKFHAKLIIEKKLPGDEVDLDIVQKEVRLVLGQASTACINLPVAQAIAKRFGKSKSAGYGQANAYGVFKLSKTAVNNHMLRYSFSEKQTVEYERTRLCHGTF